MISSIQSISVSLTSFSKRKKQYRITKVNSFDLYEQKQLTRHHHNLKEEENVYKNRLQKCIDIVFPEFNKLFNSKYGIVYMNILKMFGSAENIANTDIRTIRKCFEIEGRGNRIFLTPERLKECARILHWYFFISGGYSNKTLNRSNRTD